MVVTIITVDEEYLWKSGLRRIYGFRVIVFQKNKFVKKFFRIHCFQENKNDILGNEIFASVDIL